MGEWQEVHGSMSLRGNTAIVGIGETPVDRLGRRPGERRRTIPEYLTWAARLALEDAGLERKDFDGQGLAAIYTTNYLQPFWPEETASILGITPALSLASANGGAGSVSALGQAAAAIQSGLVERVLCVAASAAFVETHNGVEPRDTRDFEVPYGLMGANSAIALVMRRHMYEYGTTLEALGNIAVTARYHASLNPNAYLRKPLTLEDYKTSRLVADPVRLLDCVLPANGGKAFILTSAVKAAAMPRKPVYLMGFGEQDNPSYGPRTHSDALMMGIRDAGARAFHMAGVTPGDMDFAELYDDYVIIELMQIEDLGFCDKGDVEYFESTDFSLTGTLPIQTGGGMINCGQPSTAGGMVHILEAVTQLRGDGGARQVANARTGVVTGLGGLPYGKNLGSTAVAILSNGTGHSSG